MVDYVPIIADDNWGKKMVIDINPVALDLGFFQIHWYGLMYLLAFLAAYWLGNIRAKNNPLWDKEKVSDLIFYGAMGVVIGGRIGYVLFYNFDSFLSNPLNLFKVWQGGMSFHGGLIGVLVAGWLFGKKYNKTFFEVTDFVAPLVPIGLGAGRMGNFINGELWGKATDLPWGMIFINSDPAKLTRHPSMLYEMVLEGIVLFIIIWWFSSKPRPLAVVSGLWVLLYGTFRFAVEFVRLPDAHLGYLAWDWVTMGQVLSLPMMLLGAAIMVWGYSRAKI